VDPHHISRRDRRTREDLTEADEPIDDEGGSFGPFYPDDDDGAVPVHGWLGAIGQMVAALLVVVALIALFIGVAAALRWVWP
jgi:hypothetical protein